MKQTIGLILTALLLVGFAGALGEACAASPGPSPAAQEAETLCARAVEELRAEHDAGATCEAAKQKVLADNPRCQLHFTCRDGGK